VPSFIAPGTPPNPPNLTRRDARLGVPRDVQPILGRKFFWASTHETDPHKAFIKAAPLIAGWREQIEAARAAANDPRKSENERLTKDYRRYRNKSLDDAGAALLMDAFDFVFQRQGGMTFVAQAKAPTDTRGDVAEALESLRNPTLAADTLAQISGRATPMLAHLDRWKTATHLRDKTLAQYIVDIEQFALAVMHPIESLTGAHVQTWIEKRLMSDSVATVRRKLSGLRSYWEWMQSHDIVSDDARPFWGRKVNGGKSGAEKANEARDRFQPADVVRLWRTADAKGDRMLAATIRIAAYSGIRREGICSLTAASIRRDPDSGIGYFHVAEKTKSGVRDVPIHSAIATLVANLMQHQDADGYLIHSSGDRYGHRSDAVGKRFTRLKQDLGFGKRHVFHSVRHTFAHLLESAECPEGVAQDLCGHAKVGMTFGLYSGRTRLDHRRDWLERAVQYPT
jgi:integrase